MAKNNHWMTKLAKMLENRIHKKAWYMDSYTEFSGDAGRIYDYQVADYAKKHLRFIDRFNLRKVATAMMLSFNILDKSIEEPKIKNGKWKFYKDF